MDEITATEKPLLSAHQRLTALQNELKVPKKNACGKYYKYRSCEDILENVKPLLIQYHFTLILSDKIELIGDRFYVVATATLHSQDGQVEFTTKGYARETMEKKTMDDAQITGSCSSYARKYALNGLFCIDETDMDIDTQDNTQQKVIQNKPIKNTISNVNIQDALNEIKNTISQEQLQNVWKQITKDKQFYELHQTQLCELKDSKKNEFAKV